MPPTGSQCVSKKRFRKIDAISVAAKPRANHDQRCDGGMKTPPASTPHICSKVRFILRLPEGRSDCGRTLQQSELPGTAFADSPLWGSRSWGKTMFEFQDLFQWDRFITPTIIKTFYWLVIALICLMGLSGIFSGLALMAISPFSGFLVVLSSIAGVVVGIVFSRIVSEFILI